MQIQSTRFGQLEISHSDLIFMPHGLIGFEEYRHWVLLASKESEELAWLQSVALSHVALPMISPRRFVPNYRLQVQRPKEPCDSELHTPLGRPGHRHRRSTP